MQELLNSLLNPAALEQLKEVERRSAKLEEIKIKIESYRRYVDAIQASNGKFTLHDDGGCTIEFPFVKAPTSEFEKLIKGMYVDHYKENHIAELLTELKLLLEQWTYKPPAPEPLMIDMSLATPETIELIKTMVAETPTVLMSMDREKPSI